MYLLFQPVIILDDACHHHVSTLHVESDLPCRFILGNNYSQFIQRETLIGHKNLIQLALNSMIHSEGTP